MKQGVGLMCTLDIEQTVESFHAHAIPEDVEIGAGDVILVHDAPAGVGFGQRLEGQRHATLFRAGALTRLWTKFSSVFEIAELYEVGFRPICEMTDYERTAP